MAAHDPSTPPVHGWLRPLHLAYLPGDTTPLLDRLARELLDRFAAAGHTIHPEPGPAGELLITTAPFGRPLGWRDSVLFTARRRFGLRHTPLTFTLVHATREAFEQAIARIEKALIPAVPDPADFDFPGLADSAYRVLYEQGRRGGALLALERVVQAQAKSVRVVLVVGDEEPEIAYHFDLVGSHPATRAGPGFYEELMLRIVTAASTTEITDHRVIDGLLPYEAWEALATPQAMTRASLELGKRDFFTHTVVVGDLVKVPAVGGAVAGQYSEGCFATYEPAVGGLISTVTGSARPIDKGRLDEADLALLVGVRPDGAGAMVRHVAGRRNDPPSSEAVEMIAIDELLPRIRLGSGWGSPGEVPVVRSKLHGHRGVSSFDPDVVEYVPLEPAYQHYLVTCGSEAQAHGVRHAFSRSAALLDPADPRRLVFTVLPGHGVVVAEKWIDGMAPFESIWTAMDSGAIVFDSRVAQGPLWYSPSGDGHLVMEEPDTR